MYIQRKIPVVNASATLVLLVTVLLVTGTSFQSHTFQQNTEIRGAWQTTSGEEEQVLLFVDGYVTHTAYDRKNKRFLKTRGGLYSYSNGRLSVQYEFDTENKDRVGQNVHYAALLQGNSLKTNIDGAEKSWIRVDDGTAHLSGVWKISARTEDGKLVPIHQSGTRKTIKILTGSRFQWAAIDPGTKAFMGTGGGTYTFADGKYTEYIDFFSRDSSRVGSTLAFHARLENGDWHHSGLSSRGEPIYEVWSRKP